MPNRLLHERSPYLLQHAHNPVDWYPWGQEAFSRAQSEDRPILLSVGYSACHWCHVMERESFENEAIAALMNERFVNIKVDREERPDVDQVYMAAVQAMTGQGGWPMTVFLTPDGRPYFGGTYFPPDDRYGRPGFVRVLTGASTAYRQHRDQVDVNARQILAHAHPPDLERTALSQDVVVKATEGLVQAFDRHHGGFGRAPKFPQAMALDFILWRLAGHGEAPGARRLEEVLTRTLDEMAAGGIFDHLGGGFHRYSTDDEWLAPHFEKMLYDNALLARLYLRAGRLLRRPSWIATAYKTLDWAIREMRHPDGGFYSALDADSEGEEGKYYVWDFADAQAALGPGSEAFMAFYDLTAGGNWEGKSILRHAPRAEAPPEFEPLEARLLVERDRRVRPGLDDKTIAAWNGLMLEALATASGQDGTGKYAATATALAGFLVDRMWTDDGLMRIWKDGQASVPGFLDDHANVASGLLALYEATFDERWFEAARRLADQAIAQFWDAPGERFYDSGTRNEKLVVRSQDVFDNATPSGSSALSDVLLRLAHLTGEERYGALARLSLSGVAELAGRYPTGFGRALSAIDLALAEVVEVAIAGDLADPRTESLLRVVRESRTPYKVVAASAGASAVPLLHDRPLIDGRPTAYVCRDFACQAPIATPEELERSLTR